LAESWARRARAFFNNTRLFWSSFFGVQYRNARCWLLACCSPLIAMQRLLALAVDLSWHCLRVYVASGSRKTRIPNSPTHRHIPAFCISWHCVSLFRSNLSHPRCSLLTSLFMTSSTEDAPASVGATESPLYSLLAERPPFNSLLHSAKFPDFEDFVVKFTQNGTTIQAFLKLSGGELRVFLEAVCCGSGEIPKSQAHAVFPLQLLSGIVLDVATLSLAFAPHTDTVFVLRTGHFREAVLLKEAIQLSHNLAASGHPDCFCKDIPLGTEFINPQKKWWNNLEPNYTKPEHDPRRRRRGDRQSSIAGLEMELFSHDDALSNNRKRRGTLVNASNVRSLSKCGFVWFTDLSKKPFCSCIPVKAKRFVADLSCVTGLLGPSLKLFDSLDVASRVVKFSFSITSITNLSCDNGAIGMTVSGSLSYLLHTEDEEDLRDWFSMLSEAFIMSGGDSSALDVHAVATNSALTVFQLKMQQQIEWFRLTPDDQYSKISMDFLNLFAASKRQESLESFICLFPAVTNLAVDLAELLGGSTSLGKAMNLYYDVIRSFLERIMPGQYGWTKVPLNELVVLIEWLLDFELCFLTSKVHIPSPGIAEIPEFLEIMRVCCCNRSGWVMVPKDESGQEFSKRWLLLRGRYLQYKVSDNKDDRAIETISVSQLSNDPCNAGPLLTLNLDRSFEADILDVPQLYEIKFKFASEEEAVSWRDDVVQLRFALQSSESYIPKKPVPVFKMKFDEDPTLLAKSIEDEYEKTFIGDENDIQGIQRCFKIVFEACQQDLDDLLVGDDCEECLKFVLNLYAALIRGTILNWVEYHSDNGFENFDNEESDPDSQLGLMSEVSAEFYETFYCYDVTIAQNYDIRYDSRVCLLISHYVSAKVAKMEVLLLRTVEDHYADIDRDHNGMFENPIKHTVFSFIHQGFLVVRNKTKNHPTALKTYIEECIGSAKHPSALQKVLQKWTSRVFDYLNHDEESRLRHQQLQQQQLANQIPTKEQCVQVLCATMNGIFESRMCIVELVANDELQPFVVTPDSLCVIEKHHILWAQLQQAISSCRKVETDFKSQCELVRVKDRKPLGGFVEGSCLRLLVDKIAQDLGDLFDVVKLDNPMWLKDTRLIEDVISIIDPILSFLKTCIVDQVFRNVLRGTFLRVVNIYIVHFLKMKKPLILQKAEEFFDQVQEATWVMCTRDKEELLSSMLKIQGVAHPKDADIAIFHPMTKISEALCEGISFFQDTFLELQSFGAPLFVAKVLLAFKADISDDERSSELQKLISSSIEPPPSDDEDESTSANAPPPFSVFHQKIGHFDRIDPHWKDKRDKDRAARLSLKGLTPSEPSFRVSTFDASKVAVETVQLVAASAKQATQGSVSWFDSYIMKAEGLFIGSGRRKVLTLDSQQSVASVPLAFRTVEYSDIVAVSMDDLFGDDRNSDSVTALEDVVPLHDSVPKKKLAWSRKRTASVYSTPNSVSAHVSDSASESFPPVFEDDSSAVAESEFAFDQNGSTLLHTASHLDPSAHSNYAQADTSDKMPDAALGHPNHIDLEAESANANIQSNDEELSTSPASLSSSLGLLGLFKESTKKLDVFLSGGSPARPSAVATSNPHSISTTLVNGASKQAPADAHDSSSSAPLQTADSVIPDPVSAKQETVGAGDVSTVTAAASPSSSGGLLGLFKESTKKLDVFLSGGSPARPSAVATSNPHSISTVHAHQAP
jgi:hypothetical protein